MSVVAIKIGVGDGVNAGVSYCTVRRVVCHSSCKSIVETTGTLNENWLAR
ncbi:hypothetical protein PC119_g23433 [Phytophthora cactorum]|nr:hypothetical protein PC119_g23433 [Phytophthora cactorum]